VYPVLQLPNRNIGAEEEGESSNQKEGDGNGEEMFFKFLQ